MIASLETAAVRDDVVALARLRGHLHRLSAVHQTDEFFLTLQEALAGRYSLLRELGRGGMGIVYLAREVRLDRLVAIKVLPPTRATPVQRERFLREARTAAKLSHPGIVPVHAVDETGEFVFIAMGYVDGESLGARVAARGRLPASEAGRILKDVAWALAYAHAQGVVHRDIKPDNILLERGTGRSLVADFGIAHVAEGSGITMVGQVLGTPEYMSPEQAGGQEVDGRSDIYALGAVGYFALSGRPPFMAPTVNAVLAQQITQPAVPLLTAAADVPPRLAQVVDRCLLKPRSERYASGEEVAEAIEAALGHLHELPAPLERWVHSVDQLRLRHVLLLPMLIYPVLTMLNLLLQSLGDKIRFFEGVFFGDWLTAVVAFLLPFLVYGAARWRDARVVLAQGYEVGDLRAALSVEIKRLTDSERPTARLPRRLWTAIPGVAIATIGLTTVGECYDGNGSDGGMLLVGGWLAVAGALMLGHALRTGVLPSEVLDLGARRSVWQGRLGDWLARLAGLGLRRTDRPAVTHRPTEFALGSAAAAIFEALPKEVRRELRAIPEAIHRLETQAQSLRSRLDEIAGLEAAGGAGADRFTAAELADRREALRTQLSARRDRTERLLSGVVTALETVRLDLLRLRAGAVDAASVSSDIALASEVGVEVDAALAGLEEADALLHRNTGRPGPVGGRWGTT